MDVFASDKRSFGSIDTSDAIGGVKVDVQTRQEYDDQDQDREMVLPESHRVRKTAGLV